ncbi:MAG: hypothetical protein JRI23_17690 [Deltaproteobacteria bacterium]|jgi:hypothetical protein|nr:hypothetical protein [Deltaproteobacteria bacterium]MBW2533663.1 hypothetical protein [Deltaproteobacteria bacterium]
MSKTYSRWVLSLLTIGALATTAGDASATEPCESPLPEAGAPVRAFHGPADLGAVPEACPATAAALRGGMSILIAEQDYYGGVVAGGALRARFELPGGSWFSATLPGVEYRLAVNATVEADSLDMSASTVGWHVPLRLADRLQLAPYVRAMLPTETVFENATRYGFEHGTAAVFNVHPMLEVMGGYSIPLLLTHNNGTTHSLYTPTLAVDAGFRPWTWFELVGGMAVRVAPQDDEPFESFDPRVALRFYPWRGLYVDVAGAFPLGGRDRTNANLGLSLGWILGTSSGD